MPFFKGKILLSSNFEKKQLDFGSRKTNVFRLKFHDIHTHFLFYKPKLKSCDISKSRKYNRLLLSPESLEKHTLHYYNIFHGSMNGSFQTIIFFLCSKHLLANITSLRRFIIYGLGIKNISKPNSYFFI